LAVQSLLCLLPGQICTIYHYRIWGKGKEYSCQFLEEQQVLPAVFNNFEHQTSHQTSSYLIFVVIG
jgi:hypothetical protein